jgi:uncharacterized protein
MSREFYPSRCWTDLRVAPCPSPLGGTGGFAIAPIKEGEIVQIMVGALLTDSQLAAAFEEFGRKGRYLNTLQVDEDLNIADLYGTLEVPLNHSCDSNLWMADEVTTVARRDIAPGEEVTVDYSLQTVHSVLLLEAPCRCGSPLCRHIVTGDDWLLPELQARYKGHFSPFIEARIAARNR